MSVTLLRWRRRRRRGGGGEEEEEWESVAELGSFLTQQN
jgi:hypothetical protein